VSLNEIAVLFRARYQAAELELELSRRQIPYILRGGVRFFEQAHIKDVLSYLKILDNPRDEIAWHRATTLYPGIGVGTARQCHDAYLKRLDAGEDRSILGEADFPGRINKRAQGGMDQFKTLMRALMNPNDADHPDLLIQRILDAGYAKLLQTRFENSRDRYEDLQELANFAHTYKTTTLFLNDVALRENFRGESFVGGQAAPDEQLVLSTIHQAKGLEWKAVFILSLAEGQFPHHLARGDDNAIEEERRLFYVAATRSKEELYMIHPMTRYDRELGTVLSRISPFIEELPSHAYEIAEVVQETSQEALDPFENSISVDE